MEAGAAPKDKKEGEHSREKQEVSSAARAPTLQLASAAKGEASKANEPEKERLSNAAAAFSSHFCPRRFEEEEKKRIVQYKHVAHCVARLVSE